MKGIFSNEFARHGVRLGLAREKYPKAAQPWIDLSTGVNPKPYPAPRLSTQARARLPDPQQLRALEAAAASAFGVDDAKRVVALAGCESAVRLLPYALSAPSYSMIVWPTYSSHAAAWESFGAQVGRIDSVERASPVHGAVLTLVNPNNPDGVICEPKRVLAAYERMALRKGFMLVDETYAETEPSCSVAALAGSERYKNLVVMRSFGKFYGLAGVRLGFVIAAPEIVARLRALVGEWPIAADAIVAGLAAYGDPAWAERTRTRLRSAARRLDALLINKGLQIVGGTSLFRLARSEIARVRFEQLLRAGILVRPFDHDTTLLRIGLPYGKTEWRRLEEALRRKLWAN